MFKSSWNLQFGSKSTKTGGIIQINKTPNKYNVIIKGSLMGETSVLRTFRMSGKELVKERVSQRKS